MFLGIFTNILPIFYSFKLFGGGCDIVTLNMLYLNEFLGGRAKGLAYCPYVIPSQTICPLNLLKNTNPCRYVL